MKPKQRILRMKSDRTGNTFFYGPGHINDVRRCLLCWREGKRFCGVPQDAAWLEMVTSQRDPGGPDVWDIEPDGQLNRVPATIHSTLARWLSQSHAKGYKYLTVYYSTATVVLP